MLPRPVWIFLAICSVPLWIGYSYPYLVLLARLLPVPKPVEVSEAAKLVYCGENSAWVDCKRHVNRDANVCKIWYGKRLVADGVFQVRGLHRAALEDELKCIVLGPTRMDGMVDEYELFVRRGGQRKVLVLEKIE